MFGNVEPILLMLLHKLTHCGLVTPYGDKDLGQHWLRKWLVAWQHQAITWNNVDWSSVKSSDNHIRATSQEIPQPSNTKIHLKITYIKFHSNFPGANELIVMCVPEPTFVIILKLCLTVYISKENLAEFHLPYKQFYFPWAASRCNSICWALNQVMKWCNKHKNTNAEKIFSSKHLIQS